MFGCVIVRLRLNKGLFVCVSVYMNLMVYSGHTELLQDRFILGIPKIVWKGRGTDKQNYNKIFRGHARDMSLRKSQFFGQAEL